MGYYQICNNKEKFYKLIIQGLENQVIIILKKTLRGKTPSQYEHTRATGQGSKPTTRCLKTQVSAAKKANAQLDNQVGNGTLGQKTIGQTAINSKVSTAKRAKAQLSNQVGYGPSGHKL